MKDIYVVLDIGSSTIKLVAGEIIGTNLHVLFADKMNSTGVHYGAIEDTSAVIRDVRSLILKAEEMLETKIHSVAITIPSTGSNLYQGDGFVEFDKANFISVDDLVTCIQNTTKQPFDKKEDIVSVMPVRYHVDKKIHTDIPLGLKVKHLGVDAMIVTNKKKVLYPYITTVESLGINTLEMCVDAYASAKEVFDVVYLNEGAILMDVGYKKTTVSYFKDGYLQSLLNCAMGGYSFTKRIAQEFQITINQAENYKIKYGSLVSKENHNDIIHTTHLNESHKDYTQGDLCAILEDEAMKLMEEVKSLLSVIDDVSRKEIVLIGGGANLTILNDVASTVLQSPVRTYYPGSVGARDIAYVPCLGLIYYLVEKSKLVGKYPSSCVLPDITSTMSIRFKGLTKPNKSKNTKITQAIDMLLGEE